MGSIKRPGLDIWKMSLLNDQVHHRKNRFYFRAATANFWALLNDLVWIFGKNLYQTTITIFFSNSRSLERPGLIIESLEEDVPQLANKSIYFDPFEWMKFYSAILKSQKKSFCRVPLANVIGLLFWIVSFDPWLAFVLTS